MFCPKCGNQAPDGAAFCGKCGYKFPAPAVSNQVNIGNGAPPLTVQGATSQASSGSAVAADPAAFSGLRITPVGIVAIVLAIIAVIISLMPWYELSYMMKGASSLTSGIGTLLGASKDSLSFQDEYAIWNLVGLSNSFSNTVSAYSSFGGSKAGGAAIIVTLFAWGCLICWIVSVGLTIWGSINGFIKGDMNILRVGIILMFVAVIVFYIFTALMGSDTGMTNMMPAFCLVVSIAAFICSLVAKKKA